MAELLEQARSRFEAQGVDCEVIEREGKPGPEGSMMRLFYGALSQRIYQLGMDLLGPDRLELSPMAQGWTHPYLRTFCRES